jgi:hypothetical protein
MINFGCIAYVSSEAVSLLCPSGMNLAYTQHFTDFFIYLIYIDKDHILCLFTTSAFYVA